MKKQLIYKTIDIPVPSEEYWFHQEHLMNCKPYDAKEGERVAEYSAQLTSNYLVSFSIYNCSEEEGGPYIDPVCLIRIEYAKSGIPVYTDYIVGDVLDDMSSSISFIVDGVEYECGLREEIS